MFAPKSMGPDPRRPVRAILYLMEPSAIRADEAPSLHDLRKQLEDYCRKLGWAVVGEFVEARTAINGDRSCFKELLEDAKLGERRFEKIVLHSLPAVLRDPIEAERAAQQMGMLGIEIVSIVYGRGNIGMEDQAHRLSALFDEHVSRQTSKQVKRKLQETAKAGFWCGGPVPYGFRTHVAEMHGGTARKKLEVEPLEAEVVRKMFDLLENGDGQSGPIGVKAVTAWLNENGYRTRGGTRWTIAVVHRLLTNCALKGDYLYGKKADAETAIHVSVPAIIPAHRFDRVQKILRNQTPKKPDARTANKEKR